MMTHHACCLLILKFSFSNLFEDWPKLIPNLAATYLLIFCSLMILIQFNSAKLHFQNDHWLSNPQSVQLSLQWYSWIVLWNIGLWIILASIITLTESANSEKEWFINALSFADSTTTSSSAHQLSFVLFSFTYQESSGSCT